MNSDPHNEEIGIPTSKKATIVVPDRIEAGYVVLPYSEDQFKDFVKSLLGSQQKLSRKIDCEFSIDIDDLNNLYHLLLQRIEQQNGGVLAQFRAKIYFSDSSSIELNSIEEFTTYNEVRPLISYKVIMTWDFIIRFPDKKHPEKNSIMVEVRDSSGGRGASYSSFSPLLDWLVVDDYSFLGYITYDIEYTARTWGADIDALLNNHFKSLIKINEPRSFLQRHTDIITGFSTLSLLFTLIYGIYAAIEEIGNYFLNQFRSLSIDSVISTTTISVQLDYLASIFISGIWEKISIIIFFVAFASVLIVLYFYRWMARNLKYATRRESFLLLTKGARNNKASFLLKRERDWRKGLVAFSVNIILNIIASIIFTLMFQR